MYFQLPPQIRSLLKATKFWQDNYLLLREFKHFRELAIVAVLSTLLGAALEGVTVGLIASFLQGLTSPYEPPIQTGIEWFDVWVLATQASAIRRVYQLSALILLAIWLRSGLKYVGELYSRLCGLNLAKRLRILIFEQFQSLSLSYYSQTRSGELINSVTSEVNQLQEAFSIVSNFLTGSSTLLAYVVAMFWISWPLSIVAVMLLSLLSVGLSTLIGKVREVSFDLPKANGRFASVAIEFINGIRVIKGSGTQDFERRRMYGAIDGILKVNYKVTTMSALVGPLVEGASITILLAMVLLAFHFFVMGNGELRATSLLTFMFALFRMRPLVSQVNSARTSFSRFRGPLNNIKELLRRDDKVYIKNGTIPFSGLEQAIDLVSVDFGYNVDEPVLREITLSIQKDQTTALVGGTGAGKSTLVDLIPRFHDPTRGQVLIDGVDLRELEINSLRQRMAIVSQDTFIFSNSVRHNIAYGMEDVDEAAIQKVAQQANAWDFIQELPEGLDTMLGDRGVRLSGGQRQRIAIARALLRNPEILILDEATSALDSLTERLIQESIKKLSKGRTVIAIAHRLSTIVQADQVVVLEQGQIVEQGGYQKLLDERGKLWEYHRMQYELDEAG